ncbi:hypothetical protein PIB30_028040 [Stylosanthes scabra]|uniref:Uncharacterized protein n=1 Tax=Stylosanthes scabra TaxID=79078 RepID=A0ABU6Z7M9_9FABA|nr:hypothetical protein [Stylosanthes scabra]
MSIIGFSADQLLPCRLWRCVLRSSLDHRVDQLLPYGFREECVDQLLPCRFREECVRSGKRRRKCGSGGYDYTGSIGRRRRRRKKKEEEKVMATARAEEEEEVTVVWMAVTEAVGKRKKGVNIAIEDESSSLEKLTPSLKVIVQELLYDEENDKSYLG